MQSSRRSRMLVPLTLFWLVSVGSAAAQQSPEILVGAVVERNYSTQPGIQVSYEGPSLLSTRPRFSASYTTTRISTAAGSNALSEDRFQLGVGWHLRERRRISPHLGVNVGYTTFEREDQQVFALLDHRAAIVSLLAGVEARLPAGLRLSGDVGYSHLQSSTVYPLVVKVGLHYHLNRAAPR